MERHGTSAGIWALIAATALVSRIWLWCAGLGFEMASAAVPALAVAASCALARYYATSRTEPRIAAALTAAAQIIAFIAAAESLSYAVSSLGMPLCDGALAAWDERIGLDWCAYLAWVDAHPGLAAAMRAAYGSLPLQIILAIAALGLGGRLRPLDRFVLSLMLAALATILISAILPAVETFVHFGLYPRDFAVVGDTGAYARAAILRQLEDGTTRTVSLTGAEGIIAFPSLHAALGVIFAASFWSHRWLRWPVLALNLLMLAATPVFGGHYFVDVLSGIGIAAGALAGASALAAPRRAVAAALRPQPVGAAGA